MRFDDRVVDLVMREVAPPQQHVGRIQTRGVEAVLRLLERRRRNVVAGQSFRQQPRDGVVHAVGIDADTAGFFRS